VRENPSIYIKEIRVADSDASRNHNSAENFNQFKPDSLSLQEAITALFQVATREHTAELSKHHDEVSADREISIAIQNHNYVTRLSTQELFFSTTQKALDKSQFQAIISYIFKLAEDSSQGVHLLLSSFNVKSGNKETADLETQEEIVNVAVYVECGPYPKLHFISKNTFSYIEATLLNEHESYFSQGSTSGSATPPEFPAAMVAGGDAIVNTDNVFEIKTEGGAAFTQVVEICVDHANSHGLEMLRQSIKYTPDQMKIPSLASQIVTSASTRIEESSLVCTDGKVTHIDPLEGFHAFSNTIEFSEAELVNMNSQFQTVKMLATKIQIPEGMEAVFSYRVDKVSTIRADLQATVTIHNAYADWLKNRPRDDLARISKKSNIEKIAFLLNIAENIDNPSTLLQIARHPYSQNDIVRNELVDNVSINSEALTKIATETTDVQLLVKIITHVNADDKIKIFIINKMWLNKSFSELADLLIHSPDLVHFFKVEKSPLDNIFLFLLEHLDEKKQERFMFAVAGQAMFFRGVLFPKEGFSEFSERFINSLTKLRYGKEGTEKLILERIIQMKDIFLINSYHNIFRILSLFSSDAGKSHFIQCIGGVENFKYTDATKDPCFVPVILSLSKSDLNNVIDQLIANNEVVNLSFSQDRDGDEFSFFLKCINPDKRNDFIRALGIEKIISLMQSNYSALSKKDSDQIISIYPELQTPPQVSRLQVSMFPSHLDHTTSEARSAPNADDAQDIPHTPK
jgi:hypothetical protein